MTTRSRNAHDWTILAAMATLYLIWGSTYLGIRFALETLPPFLMAGSRFIVAGTALYIWKRTQGVPHPTPVQWRSAFIIGALLLLGSNGGVTWATQSVPSGLVSLLVGAVPLWAVLLDWLFFGGPRPNQRMALGLSVGILGLVVLIGPMDIAGKQAIDPLGALVLLGASLSWATGSLYSRRLPLPGAPLMATGSEMIIGGLLLTTVGTLSGEWAELDLAYVSLKSTLAMVYLTLSGSLIAFSVYIWLLKHTTTARATSYAYATPVIALFLGWLLADEPLTLRTILAAAIIIGSVVLITSLRAQSDRPDTQAETGPVDISRPMVPKKRRIPRLAPRGLGK